MGILRKIFKPMFEREKWRILRGDKVIITAGKDKGQIGTVLKVIRDDKFPRVVVEGLNLSKRSIKRTKDNPGGIVSVESPLHYSNVSIVDPVTNAPVKVSFRYLEDGTKIRMTRGKLASGSVIPRPDILKLRRKPRPAEVGPKDTTVPATRASSHTAGDLPSALKKMLEAESLNANTVGAAMAPPRIVMGKRGAVLQSRNSYRSFASSCF